MILGPTKWQGKTTQPVVTFVVVLLVGLTILYVVKQRETPELLSTEQQKLAGMSSDGYRQVQELRTSFRTGSQSEADWQSVERLMFGKSPLGQANAFACLFKLKSEGEQRRALALLEKHAASVPADEPLHDLAPDVIQQIASDGSMYKNPAGLEVVREWANGSVDSRLKSAATDVVKDCKDRFSR